MANNSLTDAPLKVLPNKYDEWIKMATENRITSQNSWNVALIDYFYDMSLLKDGNRINFQKASSALDGCVRVYASRVDYAANEMGRLVNGLTTNNDIDTNIDINNDKEVDEQSQNEEDEAMAGGSKKSTKRKSRLQNQVTLFKSFDKIRIRDSDKPTISDPIFKKSLTDFDEGGAKNLLHNLLSVDSRGQMEFKTLMKFDINCKWQNANIRVLQDILKDDPTFSKSLTSKNLSEVEVLHEKKNSNELDNFTLNGDKKIDKRQHHQSFNNEIDFQKLSAIVNFDVTSSYTISPSTDSLKQITNGEMNISELAAKLETLPLINADTYHDVSLADVLADDNNAIQNENSPVIFETSHISIPMELAEDQNADVDLSKRTQYSLFLDDEDSGSQPNLTLTRLFDEDVLVNDEEQKTESIRTEDLLTLFDSLYNKSLYPQARSKSSVFWKIKELRKSLNSSQHFDDKETGKALRSTKTPKHAENKNLYNSDDLEDEELYGIHDISRVLFDQKPSSCIDFVGGASDKDYTLLEIDDITSNEALMFERPRHLSRLIQPSLTEDSRGEKFTLLNDHNFTAKKLAYLFLKPKQILNSFMTGAPSSLFFKQGAKYCDQEKENLLANSQFFANKYLEEDHKPEGDILADNDQEDLDIPDFDAWDVEQPINEIMNQTSQSQSWPLNQRGNQLTYSKKSKKVDIRLLKINIWNSIENQSLTKKRPIKKQKAKKDTEANSSDSLEVSSSDDDLDPNAYLEKHATSELKFTEILKTAMESYSGDTKNELSTSYCFISLLHLANEQGMILNGTIDNNDIIIRR